MKPRYHPNGIFVDVTYKDEPRTRLTYYFDSIEDFENFKTSQRARILTVERYCAK